MGEIALRRFFLAVFCALALSLSALAADAALPSLEAAVNVREDGVCEVTMTAEVDFSAAQDSLLIPLGTDARDITLAGWSYETVLQDGVTCRLQRQAAVHLQLYAAVPCGRGRRRPAVPPEPARDGLGLCH